MILNNVILKNRNDYTPVSESESIFSNFNFNNYDNL